jgi:hypothetical protein
LTVILSGRMVGTPRSVPARAVVEGEEPGAVHDPGSVSPDRPPDGGEAAGVRPVAPEHNAVDEESR